MQALQMEEYRIVGFCVRTYSHRQFEVPELVTARKRRRISVSVCIPARDEERTIAGVVSPICEQLTSSGGGAALVEEVVVVDDGSSDSTAGVAAGAGARVVRRTGAEGGKGEAMRLALSESDGDLVVFLDGDVESFSPHFVTGLLGPLLLDEEPVALVKGFYDRPLHGEPSGGGRVTELMARPLIDTLFPHLVGVRQPLAGESAAPRWVLEKTGLDGGYGAELGLLVDVASFFATGSIAQVDLGVRVHRNRPLEQLRDQATDVLRAALRRADVRSPGIP